MLRHDYDHDIASWIGLPLGVLAGVLAGEAAFLMAEHSTDAHYFVETFAIVLRAFYVLAMVVMGSMMFDKMQPVMGRLLISRFPPRHSRNISSTGWRRLWQRSELLLSGWSPPTPFGWRSA